MRERPVVAESVLMAAWRPNRPATALVKQRGNDVPSYAAMRAAPMLDAVYWDGHPSR